MLKGKHISRRFRAVCMVTETVSQYLLLNLLKKLKMWQRVPSTKKKSPINFSSKNLKCRNYTRLSHNNGNFKVLCFQRNPIPVSHMQIGFLICVPFGSKHHIMVSGHLLYHFLIIQREPTPAMITPDARIKFLFYGVLLTM